MEYSDDDSDTEERICKSSAMCEIKACASPWMRITNLKGHTFYRHVPTGETTWEFPTNSVQSTNSQQTHSTLEADHFIDSDWQMYEDEYGNTYYYNQKNKESKWRIPCTLPETTQSAQSDREELSQWKQKMTGAGWGPWLKSKTSRVLHAVGGMGTVVRRLSTLAYRKASDAVTGWVSSATDDDEHSGRESRWRDAESPLPFDRKQQNAREPLGHITPQRQRTASRGDVPRSLKAGSPLTRPPLHSPAPPPDLPQMRAGESNSVLRPLVLPWAPPAAEHALCYR